MVTVILAVSMVLQAHALMKRWTRGDGEFTSPRWQAVVFVLTLVACAILLFLDFGLRVDRLPNDTPADALRTMELHDQRVAYSAVAALFAVAAFAIFILKARRRAASWNGHLMVVGTDARQVNVNA